MSKEQSIKTKLREIAKETGIAHQLLLNHLGEEQFLARLSKSKWKDSFVFKGAGLLAYSIETLRRTRDIDFSVRNVKK